MFHATDKVYNSLQKLIYLLCIVSILSFAFDIEIREVRNDSVEFSWNLPKAVAAVATSVAIKVTTMKGPFSRNSSRITLHSNESVYAFKPLVGNTTYRISVEAFYEKKSLWYSSTMVTTLLAALDWLPPPTDLTLMDKGSSYLDVSWKAPFISHQSFHHVNQHAITVYLFNPFTQQSRQVFTRSLRMPTSRMVIDNLEPSSVYNITIKAGTDYGYGATSWMVTSTLGTSETQILRLDSRTPNSLTVFWPITWLNSPQDPFTIRANTIHSIDGSSKEVSVISYIEPGRRPEYTLRHLSPGTTFNVTLSTNAFSKDRNPGVYYQDNAMHQKITWAAFSTLPQGEYLVTEARLAAETDTAVSIVFRSIEHDEDLYYELRYFSSDGENSRQTFRPEELLCPKFGCSGWNCVLFYNLPRNPRNYAFEIRVNVDGMWNKWAPISRRPWNLMERVCSITPPQKFVDNIERLEYMRKIHIPPQDPVQKAWRYFIIVDRRGSAKLAPIDIPKLSDKATAEHERIPYYITAAFAQESISNVENFIIGNGKVYGGYLNYPLDSQDDPSWTIIPVSHVETEIIEKSRTWCDDLENEISIWLVLKCIPFKYHLLFWLSFLILFIGSLFGVYYYVRKRPTQKQPSRNISNVSNVADSFRLPSTTRISNRTKKTMDKSAKRITPNNRRSKPYVSHVEEISDEESNSLFYMAYEEPQFSLEESLNGEISYRTSKN